MNMEERFLYSMRNLTHRKLRTALTILGIIVGIASIIILISLAGGLKDSILDRLANFDPDLIIVLPTQVQPGNIGGIVRQGKLYEKDYNSIRQIPGVGSMSKSISKRVTLEYRDEFVSGNVYAVEPELYTETTTFVIDKGRFLQSGDRDVVVFGGSIAEIFDEDIQVNSMVLIDGRRYRVVGILEKTGNTFSNLDSVIYMELNEGKRVFSDSFVTNEISAIQVKVIEGYDLETVSDDIEQALMRNHKVSEDDKDFGVLSSKSINEQVESIIGILSIFLSAVAAISILVGMVGISNTMFVAVMERTKEVGVLKAIGANKKEIIYIFTIEAGIMGLIGGILGLLLALLFNFTLGLFDINTNMNIFLLLGSVVFAFVIGVVAGIIPARNASKIPAIEALRYEWFYMMLLDIFKYAFNSITEQKLRSWLTIIGIILGVATIITLVAIGDGVTEDINSQLEMFGAKSIVITPGGNMMQMMGGVMGGSTLGKLYDKDFEELLRIPGIDEGSKVIYGRTTVEFKEKSFDILIFGADSNFFNLYEEALAIESGRYFEDNEKNVAVLANDAANELFGKDKVAIGNKIKIDGDEYRVVGILELIGTSMSAGDDLAIYIPFKDSREKLKDQILRDEISMMQFEIEEGVELEDITERIELRLMSLHKVNEDNKDFSIITADFVKDMMDQITGALTLFLLLISSISAVVGGIGISNTMFMSVLSKTTEIGVLKSIGARRKDILLIFIFQAAIIGLIGGVIGIGLGIVAVEVIKWYGIVPLISIQLIVLVVTFAVFIGILGGLIPAYNASKIPAIEALKY